MPSHSHSGSAASAGSHSHTGSATSSGSHTHANSLHRTSDSERDPNGLESIRVDASKEYGTQATKSAGAHTHSVTINSAGNHTHTVSVGNAGSGNKHNNTQPYITCYVWRRTAKHRTVGEMPQHSHTAAVASGGAHAHTGTASSAGAHTHNVLGPSSNGSMTSEPNPGPYMEMDYYKKDASRATSSNGSHTHSVTVKSANSHSHTVTVNNAGSGEAHQIIQPYISVYCWRRTA